MDRAAAPGRPGTRGRRRSRGQSLVEFALLLPVFMILFSTALDLGRLAAARIAVENAAREGAFQASTTPTSYQSGQPCPSPDPSGNTPTTNLVVCRTVLEAKNASVVTVSPSNITMSCSPSCTPALNSTATVSVTGQFTFLTPFMAAFFGGQTITFSSSATTQLDVTPTQPPTAGPGSPTAAPTATPAPTASAVPTPTAPPNCSGVSAGFTYTSSPANNKSPVTVTVTDTTTYNPLCSTTWVWTWGDGTPNTTGRVQSPHTYYNAGPGNKTFTISLTVTSGAYTSTYGGQTVLVKP